MEITGTVMCAACAVRPDISFAAHRLASRMQAPMERDMVAAKRVLRYLSSTRTMGLIFGGKKEQPQGTAVRESRGHAAQQVNVCAYADADWASNKEDQRSVSGWVAKLNGDLISWSRWWISNSAARGGPASPRWNGCARCERPSSGVLSVPVVMN